MDNQDVIWIKSMLNRVLEKQEKFDEKQESIDSIVRDMDKKMSSLHQTVIGNEVYGQKGLVKEVGELKDYVEKDKMMKSKIIGGLAVVGVIWTLMLEFWKNIFK